MDASKTSFATKLISPDFDILLCSTLNINLKS